MVEAGQVERLAVPTSDAFRERAVGPRKPVVLEGVLRDWPAMTRWSGDQLVARYGDVPAAVGPPEVTFRELIERVRGGADDHVDFTITQAPFLLRDITPLPYLDMRQVTFINLWVGGSQRTPLHYDLAENLHAVVQGKKRFFLVAPEDHVRLYPRTPDPEQRVALTGVELDFFAVDDERYPASRDLRYLVADLGPGDVLYLPARWYHAVQHAGAPTVAINFWWEAQIPAQPEADSFFGDRVLLSQLFGLGTGAID